MYIYNPILIVGQLNYILKHFMKDSSLTIKSKRSLVGGIVSTSNPFCTLNQETFLGPLSNTTFKYLVHVANFAFESIVMSQTQIGKQSSNLKLSSISIIFNNLIIALFTTQRRAFNPHRGMEPLTNDTA
jgi:hypothetical protein